VNKTNEYDRGTGKISGYGQLTSKHEWNRTTLIQKASAQTNIFYATKSIQTTPLEY